jgi:hypothetical protein
MSPRLAIRSTANGRGSAEQIPRYEGALQGVGNGVAVGWAADISDHAARVPVSLVVDGEIVAEGIADVARTDLLEKDIGDGAHGFLLALPDRLQTSGRRNILVLVGPERTPIPAAPSFWQQPSPDGSWSDVVFVPGGALSASVPAPPPGVENRPAVLASGWLLCLDEEEGRAVPDEGELQRLVARLRANARRCAELGIVYVPVLVPRKRDVIAPQPSAARAWVTRLNARLRDVDEVELLDLLGVLRDGAAAHGGAYHRTDADWNDRGAFYVARALLKQANQRIPVLRPPTFDELRLRAVPEYRGTLAQAPKLELKSGELHPSEAQIEAEPGVAIDPGTLQALRMPVEQELAQAGAVHLRVYAAPDHDGSARVAVVGDAAALALLPWLAERASRTTFFWTAELPMAQLELELPRVVFHLLRETDLLERSQETLLWKPPPAAPSAPIATAPAATSASPSAPPASPSAPPASPSAPPASPSAPPASPSAPPSSPTAPPATPAAPDPPTPQPPPARPSALAAALRARWETPDARWPAMLLGAGMLGFGVLLMVLSRHLGFFQDEYFWILHRRGWNADAFLEAHNGHISIVPVTIYKLLFVTVGLGHTWPYRLILVALHLLCVGLVYVLARRHAGRWIALIPAFLLLGLGAGGEDLLWAFQIGFLGSLAAGLGALLCLERHGRHSDLAAGVLVGLSVSSSSVGLAVAAAVLAELVALRAPWRRLRIVLVPLALYGLWYLRYGTGEALLSNVPKIPAVDLETGSYGFAGFAGLPEAYGQILLAGAIAYLVTRVWRGRPLPARTLAGIAGALAFWTLITLTRAQYDQPGASRYVYPSAVFILIGAIGVLRWRRFSARAWAVFALIVAAAGLSNVQPLIGYARDRTQVDTEVRDELGAAQMVGSAGAPSFLPDPHHLPFLALGEYLAAVRALGSPAFTPQQIMSEPEDDRELADNVIMGAESIPLVQPSAQALHAATPIAIRHDSGLTVAHTAIAGTPAGCTQLTPGAAAGFATVLVPPGHSLYMSLAGAGQVSIYLHRLAAHPPAQPAHVLPTAGAPALLQFPRDASTLPWRIRLVPTTPTALCLV